MSAGSAKPAATATAHRGAITADWLAAGLVRRPVSVIVIAGAIESIVVVDRSVSLAALAVEGRIVGRSSGHARTVITAAAAGKAGAAIRSADQSIAIGYRIERSQVRINACSCRTLTDDHAPTIIGVIEIRIIPAVPHVIAVPRKIRVPESETIGRTESHPISKSPICRISVAITSRKRKAAGRGIIGIVSAVVVKIRPACLVLRFHADIIVAGSGAVVFVVIGSGTGSYLLAAGRIINIIGVLCVARGRAAAHYKRKDNCKGQQGI